MAMQRSQAGLTLVELLVAVALLAVLTVMAYRGLDSMTRANQGTLAETERWRATTLFLERFGTDVSQPARRQVRAADGTLLPAWWAHPISDPPGNESQLEFTRMSAPGQDEVRLGYRLYQGRVQLLVWRVLDRAPTPAVEVYTLLDHVSLLRFRNMDAKGVWQDRWPLSAAEPLPRAVSVELKLADGPTVTRIFALP